MTRDGRLYVRPKEAAFGDKPTLEALRLDSSFNWTMRPQRVTLDQLKGYLIKARFLYELQQRRRGRSGLAKNPAGKVSRIRLRLLADRNASLLHLGWVKSIAAEAGIGHIEIGVLTRTDVRGKERPPRPAGKRNQDRTGPGTKETPVCDGVLGFLQVPDRADAMIFGDPKMIKVRGMHQATGDLNKGGDSGMPRTLVYTVDRRKAESLEEVGRRIRAIAEEYKKRGKAYFMDVHVEEGLLAKDLVPLLAEVLKTGIKDGDWNVEDSIPDARVRELRALPSPQKSGDLGGTAAKGRGAAGK